MRATLSILAAAAGVFVVIHGAFGETATLRYDGAYRHVGADKITQHVRFYRDGLVISAATPSDKTPQWLQRGFPGLASGRYSIRGGRIKVTLNVNLPDGLPDKARGSVPRTLHYTGVIGPECLELRRDGRSEPRKYDFKIAGFR